jgi:hypothetical protein
MAPNDKSSATSSCASEDKPQAPTASKHNWLDIKLGRVCESCLATQATGEFVDADDCRRNRPQ